MPNFPMDGLPPNKGVKGSMWANEEQAHRLVALRKAVKKRVPRVFAGPVRLTLKVHVGIPDWDTLDTDARRKDLKECGDLDNFVAGVCDGLMGLGKYPHPSQELAPMFCEKENEAVHPLKPIAYEDDSQVMEISAKKVIHDGDDRYEVHVEELGRE